MANASVKPLFVLSTARAGSTLLRRILNAHPAIWSPDEIDVGRLVSDLVLVLEGIEERGARRNDPCDPILTRAREVVDGLLAPAAEHNGKVFWCDKSPGNWAHLQLLTTVFPDARFICLYRHALDVVSSSIKVYREAIPPFLMPYITAARGDAIRGGLEYWMDVNEAVSRLEVEAPDRCVRIRYEDLVTSTEPSLQRVWQGLGLTADGDLMSEVFRTRPHTRLWRGDMSAIVSTAVHSERLGTGAKMRWRDAAKPVLGRLSPLLVTLGYPPLDPGGGAYSLGVSAHAASQGSMPSFLTTLLERLRDRPALWKGFHATMAFQLANTGAKWILDLRGDVPSVATEGDADYLLVADESDFDDIIEGRVEPVLAWRESRLTVHGNLDPERTGRIARALMPPSSTPT